MSNQTPNIPLNNPRVKGLGSKLLIPPLITPVFRVERLGLRFQDLNS